MKNLSITLGSLAMLVMSGCSNKTVNMPYNEGINVIPMPVSLTENSGSFTLNGETTIYVGSPDFMPTANYLAAKIKGSTGYDLKISDNPTDNNAIRFEMNPRIAAGMEGYTLNVTDKGVTAESRTPQGAFYAMQTLLQLLPAEIESPELIKGLAWAVPSVSITDEPRFPYRGMMLDICRHFNNAEFIKKQIDVLAMFKINKLHLHLTEDQLWAIEVKKYPKLTEVGSVRHEGDGTTHSGFLTQDQIKDIVAYADARYIEVIPEIELPGHALAALSAYPELSCTGGPFSPRNVWGVEEDVFCAGDEATFEFLENVLSEIIPLFSNTDYIHIGGDECPKARWAKCPKCQKRIREEILPAQNKLGKELAQTKHTNEELLQSYFVQRIEKFVESKGKKLVGWDEILEGGLAPSATVMSWRGEEGGIQAANMGNDVVMTPNDFVYLDHYQGAVEVEPISIGGYTTLEETYSYEPVPEGIAEDKQKHVIGSQGNVWTEYMYTGDIVEYRTYPRMLAIAEYTWTPKNMKNYPDFARRINNAYVRMDMHNINYHIPMPEGPVCDIVVSTGESAVMEFSNTRGYPMVYTTDGSEPTSKSDVYTAPITVKDGQSVKIATLLQSGKMSRVRTITAAKQAFAPAVEGDSKIKVKIADGHYVDAAAYKGATFGEEFLVDSLTAVKFDMKKPSVATFSGYFDVPADDVYTFAADMDELWIDDALIINNDNKVRRHMNNKAMKALAAGTHAYTIVYNNSTFGGWPAAWNPVTFGFKGSAGTDFTMVKKK